MKMQDFQKAREFLGKTFFVPALGGHLKSGHVWSLENRP
jgi:hypothetical protein